MNLLENAGKKLLQIAGLRVPKGYLCKSPEEVKAAAAKLGSVVVKAQVPTGKRDKSGGILAADNPTDAEKFARQLFCSMIQGYSVDSVLVEERVHTARELYVSITIDAKTRNPLLLLSVGGGVNIEEIARTSPGTIFSRGISIQAGFSESDAQTFVAQLGLGVAARRIAEFITGLYDVWVRNDGELIEINPLAILADGSVVALDCKFVLDDAAIYRQSKIGASEVTTEKLTVLERRGRALGLNYMELDGDIAVLANGAGLTMATLDVVRYFGGRPANFLEIGGEAYKQAKPALELVLANERVRSLIVVFCGAFARTDVMVSGVIEAWRTLRPSVPAFFSVHGTGEDEATALLRDNLAITPYDQMEDAIVAAVEAAAR
jgi:succinyl-CoA synthetase beta subunit